MYTSVEVMPVEMVPLEVVPVETMAHDGSTGVPARETVTSHASRLAGRLDRQHNRQRGERHECHLFRTRERVHGIACLSRSHTMGR